MRSSPLSVAHSSAWLILASVFASNLHAQTPQVRIGSLDLAIGGIQATVTPAKPVIPKNIASGVQVVVTQNGNQLSASQVAQYLGGPFQLVGEYSGPGLSQTIEVPQSASAPNSLIIDLPAVAIAGNYTLSNLRFVVNGSPIFDVSPSAITVQVIDQVLVTSVQTTPLTPAQLQAMGVVLDSSSYTGFQFTVGLQLSSQVVSLSFPVVFDKQGVPIPQPIAPPQATPSGISVPLPTIVPVLLQSADGITPQPKITLPDGTVQPVKIPSVIVIPGNVGYLKQFFSAQLYVSNGAPGGSNLSVDNITGTINLPTPTDGVAADAPLSLPSLTSGPQLATMNVLAPGPGGTPSVVALNPGDTGQAEWTIRGDKEGYYTINFNINATLEGLPTGPFALAGTAMGGVLVRNPYFNMTFTVPGVVRKGELFNAFATVTNTSQVPANNLSVNFDQGSLSAVALVSPPSPVISTLNPGDSTTLTFQFQSLQTGRVVASYLNFDTSNGTSGNLNFTLGVFANGTPMSPDTLVLPSSVDNLPGDVVGAAMRVLGQAWSVANAAPNTLPASVISTSRTIVTQKALALAEAGLRVSLGEPLPNALRDLATDFFGGNPIDPGFDQVLRTTPAGQNFTSVLGTHLAQPALQAGGAVPYELQLAQMQASGPNFISFAVGSGTGAAPVSVALMDAAGNQVSNNAPGGTVVGGALFPLGASANVPSLGLLTFPINSPYTLLLAGQSAGTVDLSISIPRGDGTVVRGVASAVTVVPGQQMRVIADLTNPNNLLLQVDTAGDGGFATSIPLGTQQISPSGPSLISATVIDSQTLSQASYFGQNLVALFDRIVDGPTSSNPGNYSIPSNSVTSASKQLSGRLVFGNLAQPEGPYVPTTFSVAGVADQRGAVGPAATVSVKSMLSDPGAVVTGRVLNADGSPSSTARVTYLNTQSDAPQCSLDGTNQVALSLVAVQSNGTFQFRYVHQDQCGNPFQLATTDPNTGALREATAYVRTAGQQMVIDLGLIGQGSVTGVVKDLSGNPVYNANVVAISGTDPQVGGSTYSDATGRYTINGITVGPVTVEAAQGISSGTSAGNIERAGTTAVVNVTLNGGVVNVSGTVTQLQGNVTSPVPGAPVVYYSTPSGANPLAVGAAVTKADGTFSITGMPAGAYTITATLNTQLSASQSNVAAAGQNLNIPLQIVIPSTGTVNGRVLFPNGSPAAGVVVYQNQSGVISNPDGTFSLSGVPILPSQSQTINARTTDGLRSGQASVVVNSATTPVNGASITLSGLGTAQFTVLDATGKPVVGQTVALPDGSPPPGCGQITQTTNANGVAVFTGLGVGSVKAVAVRAQGSSQDLASAIATIPQDGVTGYATMRFNGSGTVTGSVVDPKNNPVFGAVIQLTSNTVAQDGCYLTQAVTQSLQTDPTGKFQFNQVNLGKVGVTASQSFYPTQVGAQSTLVQNGATANFSLQLVNTISGVLSGTIFLPDGATPAGAGVQVIANGPLPNVTVSTDASGNYKFAKIFPEGQYTLTADDPVSGGTNQVNIYLRAGQDTTQILRLKGTGTVNVTVVDGAGAPVSTAFVTLTETDFPNASFSGSLDASNQGVLPFQNVFEGRFSVQVTDPFGRGGRASGTLPQGTASVNSQVQLTTTGTVQGHFYMPDGLTPIPNGSIQLTANGRAIGEFTSLDTGDVGSYSFQYVPAGPVELKAQDPLTGRTGIAAGTITTQGQILTLDVKAQGLDTVQGLVTSNGSPQPGAFVTIVSGNFQASTEADTTGMYLMNGVPEGVIVATANLGNGFLSGTASSTISGDGNTLTLNVALRSSGTVTGQVLMADGVTPAPSSLVSINVGGFGGGTETTTTDTLGNFSFQFVPSGTGVIAAQVLGGIDQASAPINVAAGTTTKVTIKLNGVGAISGVALDSAGNPTPGTIILQGTGTFPYYFNLTAAADGTFSLPQILAGPFTASLTVNASGFALYGTASGNVSPNQTTKFTVQVQPSGTITGLVLRPDGQTPAIGASVVVQLNRGGSITLQAQNDGTFTAAGVPLGAFRVEITDPSTMGLAAIEGQALTSNGQAVNLGTIVLDGNALSVVASNPANGATGVGTNQPLTITFSEALAGTSGMFVTNSGANVFMNVSLSSDGKTVTLQGQMPDGLPLVLNASTQVTDVFGRQLLQPQTINFTTVDLTPPYVTAISPLYQAIQVPVNAVIAVTFNKALSTTANLSNVITVTATPGGIVSGTTSLTAPNVLTFTPAGGLVDNTIYNVTVNGAVSFGGNVQTSASSSIFVSPETLPPTLLPTSPVPIYKNFVASSQPTINFVLTDNLTGINAATATLSIDNVLVTPAVFGNTLTFTPSAPLADGLHSAVATVQNRAGVQGMASESFTVDATPPTVPQLSGITGGQIATGILALAASSSDSGSGVARIDVYVDGASAVSLPAPSFQASYNTAVLSAGTHTFTAHAVDNVGNVSAFSAAIDVVVQQTGTVVGTVVNGQGQPISGAQIILTASDGTFTTTTAANGTYQVNALPLGFVSIIATDPSTGYRTAAQGTISASGQVLTINITVIPTGTITGTVFRAGGVTPAVGVQVVLNFGSATAATDAQGHYTFTLVPLGAFTISVADLVTGDRGIASNQLSVNGQTSVINVVLDGFGTVTITVQNSAGVAVANAQVTIQGESQFGGNQSGATNASGVISFSNVFAGNFYVYASDPQTGLQGSANGSVAAGSTANIPVQLEPSGTINGKVFAADGTTPLPNVPVILIGSRSAISATDGSFQFTVVPIGSYTLMSDDSSGNRRSYANVRLVNNGDTVTQNLVWVAMGTVSGQVTSPDSTPAVGVMVTLHSDNPFLGGYLYATTDTQGAYQFALVSSGNINASASPTQGLLGEASGAITHDGQQLTLNIALVSNALTFPVNNYDGNEFTFDIQSDDSIASGTNSVFSGDFGTNSHGFLLDIVSAGTPNRFTGNPVGSGELSSQQVDVSQRNIASLNVTRKVYVPQDGYFARYLEILNNPTTSAIIVDVRITTNLRAVYSPDSVVSTSSGGTTLDVSNAQNPDRWVVIDDSTDGDPSLNYNSPATGFAFDGPGGAIPASAASFTNPLSYTGQLTYQWSSISIPANGTVAFMHFGVQQTTRAAAQASAARLVQLPPEALVGLSAQEIGEIQNFAVPAGGTSSVAPLFTSGTVGGTVLAGDGATPVANATVTFKSNNPYYGRTYTTRSGADGSFQFQTTIGNYGHCYYYCTPTTIIPVDSFSLGAIHPQTSIHAPSTPGNFATGLSTATQNVEFTGTGLLAGTVRSQAGLAVTTGGSVQVQAQFSNINAYISLAPDGSYAASGLAPGKYVLSASVSDPQGSPVGGTSTVTVVAGQVANGDITLVGTGIVQGTVTTAAGSPAAGIYVLLQVPNSSCCFSRSTSTDASGNYLLSDVPVGTYVVQATEPNTRVVTSAQVVVAQNQTAVQNLRLIGSGTLQVTVTSASGIPASNAYVDVNQGGFTYFQFAGYSDSAGHLIIPNIAVGTFTVRAHSPGNNQIFGAASGAVVNNGDVVSVSVSLPAMATVQVTVLTAGNTPFAGAQIFLLDQFQGLQFVGNANTSGVLAIPNVPQGVFTFEARDPRTGRFAGSTTGAVRASDDGQTVSVTITAPLTGSVQGSVYAGDGQTPIQYAYIQISDTGTGESLGSANTDANGFYQVPGVAPGTGGFAVTATVYLNSSNSTVSASGNITTPGQTVTVNLILPVSAITGTVSFSDGTPVSQPYVSVMQTNAAGRTITYFATRSDANGNFLVLGVGVGAFSLQAQDRNSGLNGSATGTVTSATTTVQLTVTLQPSGSVSGVVTDSGGTPAPYAQIQLNTPSSSYVQYATADAQGNYSYPEVPVGAVVVTAGPESFNGSVLGAASGLLTTSGQSLVLNVAFQPTSTLTGTVFASDGSTPVPSAALVIENPTISGGLADFYFYGFGNGTNGYLTADTSGNFTIPNVPTGTVKVVAGAGEYSNPSGAAIGNLQVGTPLTLNPVFGNAHTFGGNYNLTDVNGFLFDIDCIGETSGGGLASVNNNRSYGYAASPLLNGSSDPFCNNGPEYGLLEQARQQVTFGPRPTPGNYSNGVLQVARKIFVPQNGGFARYLEVLTNPLSTPITATLEMDSSTYSIPSVVADDPANNGATFAVTQTSDSITAVLGWVFSGSAASITPVTHFAAGQNLNSYTWTVTVPANQTVILMHFLIQRPNGNLSDAESQAQALVNLTDPNALVGMSDQEKAEVVNFNVP